MSFDIIIALSGRARPEPGSIRARRIALLARYLQPKSGYIASLLALAAGMILLRLTEDVVALLYLGFLLSFTVGMALTSEDTRLGAEDYAWTLPVTREEAFRVRFIAGVAVALLIPSLAIAARASDIVPALWSLVADGPLTQPAPPWGTAKAVVLIAIFPVGFAAQFLYSTLKAGLLARISAIGGVSLAGGVLIPGFLFSKNGPFDAAVPFIAVGLIVIFIILTFVTRHRFLNTEILPSTDAPKTTAKRPEKKIAAAPAASAASPAAPVEFRSRLAASALGPDARRRSALYRHTYGGNGAMIGWSVGLAALAAVFIPPEGLLIIHALSALAIVSYILTGWKKDIGTEEYALLLPTDRNELFFVRVAPVLAVMLALGAWSAAVSGVLNMPGAIWGFETDGAKSIVALALTPAAVISVLCIFPIGARQFLTFLWIPMIPCQFIAPRFFIACSPTELAAVLVALIVVPVFWSRHAFATKEVIPPVINTGPWGR